MKLVLWKLYIILKSPLHVHYLALIVQVIHLPLFETAITWIPAFIREYSVVPLYSGEEHSPWRSVCKHVTLSVILLFACSIWCMLNFIDENKLIIGFFLLPGWQPTVPECHHHCVQPHLHWRVSASTAAQYLLSKHSSAVSDFGVFVRRILFVMLIVLFGNVHQWQLWALA